MSNHPMQPIEIDGTGVARFRQNTIIDWLWSIGRIDLNEISILAQTSRPDFTAADQMQLAQLLGYSVSGFGDLSYADKSVVRKADAKVKALLVRRPEEHSDDAGSPTSK